MRLYDDALDADQIQSMYENGTVAVPRTELLWTDDGPRWVRFELEA